MTRAQKRWLEELRRTGFVEHGGWGQGQKNRPLWRLVELGYARFGFGPEGAFLQTQGFMPNA